MHKTAVPDVCILVYSYLCLSKATRPPDHFWSLNFSGGTIFVWLTTRPSVMLHRILGAESGARVLLKQPDHQTTFVIPCFLMKVPHIISQ